MTDEKYKNYITNYYVEGYNNLYDIWYKNIFYTIRTEYFPVPEYGKPYVAYYLKPDKSDEHITYFDTLEEMLENYHLQDGTLLLDFLTNPIYSEY